MSEPAGQKPRRILIVDDDEQLLELLAHVAQAEGFAVERACDGEDALKKAKGLAPDLVAMDFMMPGLSGFEVLKRLQAGPLAKVPVVLMTARHVDAHTLDMLRQEPNIRALLKKPIEPPRFAEVLHRILGTHPPKGR